jgi:glycosyltransferase involved in cell wall biosynthesis
MPTISVILPTYNRADYIGLALKSVLHQDLKDFEIVVLDNASTDATKEVVLSFRDARIRYIKNKTNIGYPKNIMKGFALARGKYIFLLSDDDIILQSDAFSTVYKLMEEKKVGYAQLGLMYYENDYTKPSVLDHVTTDNLYLPPSPDILLKTQSWHFGFISGNIFRKDCVKKNDIIDDVWWVYFRAIFRSITSTGCLYIGTHYIIARTSTVGLVAYLDIDKNKEFYMNKLFSIYKEFDSSPERFKVFQKKKLDIVIGTFTGIKYYTSNKNVLRITQEIINRRPEYKNSFFFLSNLCIALLLPKTILRILRYIRIQLGRRKLHNLAENIELTKHLRKALA